MKGYIKYCLLFIILVLIGIVSINLYNNSKFQIKPKKEETAIEIDQKKEETEKKVESNQEEDSELNQEEENIMQQEETSTVENNTSTDYDTDQNSDSNNNLSTNRISNSISSNNSIDMEEEDDDEEEEIEESSSVDVISNDLPLNNGESQEEFVLEVDSSIYNNAPSVSNPATSSTSNASSTPKAPTQSNPSTSSTSSSSKKEVVVEEGEFEVIEDKSKTSSVVIKDGNIIGATGYTALPSKRYLRKKASNNSAAIVVLKAGVPFKILASKKNDTWWKVEYNGKIGFVENAYCMINLPDYIPSITYKITNASKSMYKSSGVSLSVTGKQLYKTGKIYNERLGKKQYIVPVVYSFAQKILKAQKEALKNGYSLKICDAYRPTSVATEIKNSLNSLYLSNSTVRNNINISANGSYWGQSWFIAQNKSAHSYGVAIDVTLTKKGKTKSLKMPTKMHELSTKAVKYSYGVSGQTTVRADLYASSMNQSAKLLDRFMVNAGLTTLASEWWHFQDNTAYNRIKTYQPEGLNFQPTKIVSSK